MQHQVEARQRPGLKRAVPEQRFGRTRNLITAAWRLPFKRVFALTALLFFVGEFYPLSNFPMYSGVSDDADYYYLTDEAGRPVPMLTYFGIRTARAKKVFRGHLKEFTDARGVKREEGTMEERRAAGETLLRFLENNMNPGQREALDAQRIRLMWTVLTMPGGRIAAETQEIAALDLSAALSGVPPSASPGGAVSE